MSILIFIIVLAILIFVHELGHFIFAKKTGMLVEEFAIGFPPRIFSKQKGETQYSIGIIPLGGYCKILGEDYDEDEAESSKKDLNYKRRFTNQPKINQALVLVAGVTFNFLLAWLLFSVAFMSGMPVSASQFENKVVQDASLVLLDVLPDSPAEKAGLKVGDIILSLISGEEGVQDISNIEIPTGFIVSTGENEIEILYKRGEEILLTKLTPQKDLVKEGSVAIGVSFDVIGTIELGFVEAFWEGLKMTGSLIKLITISLSLFIWGIFTGTSSLAQISGPVGIVSMVGSAFDFGFVYLMTFVALISVNLGVINLIPIPALDGGRLLFLGIETIKGSPIKPRVVNTLNFLGFALLMILMLIVTVSDVFKLF
ncbi:MAG: RIP metalloprotease RseP [Candidatus Pacebacteria bacterium]|nr:RIP metalloprotease RseP [Candidatus Paceibacterota bacterium]